MQILGPSGWRLLYWQSFSFTLNNKNQVSTNTCYSRCSQYLNISDIQDILDVLDVLDISDVLDVLDVLDISDIQDVLDILDISDIQYVLDVTALHVFVLR